jgi:hypothetical protein
MKKALAQERPVSENPYCPRALRSAAALAASRCAWVWLGSFGWFGSFCGLFCGVVGLFGS